MSNIKVVIVDLDNTLVITRPAAKNAYKQAINFIAKQHGIYHLRYKLYNHWKKIVQQLLGDKKPQMRRFEFSLRRLIDEHKIPETFLPLGLHTYERELLRALKPQNGAKELLSWLKQGKVKIAIATGSERAEAVKKLKTAGLYSFIDFLVTPNETGSMKPHPAYYKLILKEFECTPDQVVVIGDSRKEDLNPAKDLGIPNLILTTGNYHLGLVKDKLEKLTAKG